MAAFGAFIVSYFSGGSPAHAAVVFTSGSLVPPAFVDPVQFSISDETPPSPPLPPPTWFRHSVQPGTIPGGVTVRAIEFYGYTESLAAPPADHGFTILLDGVRTPLAIERDIVAPSVTTNPNSTPVYRYRIDFAPFTFFGNEVVIRGQSGPSDIWGWAIDPAAGPFMIQEEFSDKNFTVGPTSTNFGASNLFLLHDTFLVIPEPATAGLVGLGLALALSRRRR